MLYMIHKANYPGLPYRGGQEPIVHLEADLYRAIAWAEGANRRWAFTASNAGSSYFEDWSDLEELHRIDWPAVQARDWRDRKEGKQAEFLMESSFPWFLITRIGVHSTAIQRQAIEALTGTGRVFVFETGSGVPPRYIINFPSKRHWRGKSRLEDIESGLRFLVKEIRDRDIPP